MANNRMTYKKAGVNISEADKFVAMIRKRIAQAWPDMAEEIGSFAGSAKISSGVKMLSSSTDGVGTKLKIAALIDRYGGIGFDGVAMSAVDAYVAGSRPTYLLDYFAVGKLNADRHIEVVDSLIAACRFAGCKILGGETAEMPGYFKYDWMIDLVTFVIGFPDKGLKKYPIQVGQEVYGWPSNGPASNGYSLLRKVYKLNDSPSKVRRRLDRVYGALWGSTLADELLRRTPIWITSIDDTIKRGVKYSGHAHITGGGLVENPPRILPDGFKMVIDRSAWIRPAIFGLTERVGKVPVKDMDRTFNNGIIITSVVSEGAIVLKNFTPAVKIGYIDKQRPGENKVELINSYND